MEGGDNLTVTWAPYSGYKVSAVYIDGRLYNDTDRLSYTFNDINADHTVYVDYASGGGSSGGDRSPQTGDCGMPMWLLMSLGAAAATALLIAGNCLKS